MNLIKDDNNMNAVSMNLSNDKLKSTVVFDEITYFVEVIVDEFTLRKCNIQPNQALAKGISLSRKAEIGESRLFDKHYKCVFTLIKNELEDGSFSISVTDIQQVHFINDSGLVEML